MAPIAAFAKQPELGIVSTGLNQRMFRGFLLFSCARVLGVWPAIAINTAIYALAHVPKGKTEGIGAVVGILFCLITLESGTIRGWQCWFIGQLH